MIPWEALVSLIISIIGSLLAVVVVLIIEGKRRPNLYFWIGEPGERREDNVGTPPYWKLLHVYVRNEPMVGILKRFLDRSPAYSCKGWITFRKPNGHRYHSARMLVRWGNTPAPEITQIRTTADGRDELRHYFDLGKVVYYFDIPPGEDAYANIPMAIRFRDEQVAYGYNNDNYQYDQKNPDWELPKGNYLVELVVQTGGRDFEYLVQLHNDGEYKDYRLTEADEQQKRAVKRAKETESR